MDKEWRHWFIVILWYGWKQRNRTVHGDTPWPRAIMWQLVQQLAGELQQLHKNASPPRKPPRRANWWKPDPGWVKLNVDGSHREDTGASAYGGLI
ncbi:hypothetical protein LINGRAHAP2_LOCUS7161 [Linum grandiflorum]